MSSNVVLGLDFGRSQNHTALAAVEQFVNPLNVLRTKDRWRYVLRGLDQYDLGLPYPTMMKMIRDRVDKPPLRGCRVAADYTGVGTPVVDILKQANLPVKIIPILITSGHKCAFDKLTNCWHVPKK